MRRLEKRIIRCSNHYTRQKDRFEGEDLEEPIEISKEGLLPLSMVIVTIVCLAFSSPHRAFTDVGSGHRLDSGVCEIRRDMELQQTAYLAELGMGRIENYLAGGNPPIA